MSYCAGCPKFDPHASPGTIVGPCGCIRPGTKEHYEAAAFRDHEARRQPVLAGGNRHERRKRAALAAEARR